jgi:6-pyruvoyltetrahydropterin/6-carboxytetrahydropterin synthase
VEGVRFSAAHFIYSDEFRENLHGHNYTAGAEIEGEIGPAGMVINFLDLKGALLEACEPLDHKVLLPGANPLVKLRGDSEGSKEVRVVCEYGEEYVFPRNAAVVLRLQNVTAENLAHYIAELLRNKLLQRATAVAITVEVKETPEFGARVRLEL